MRLSCWPILRALMLPEGTHPDAMHLAGLAASGRPVSIVCGRSDALVPPPGGEQLRAQLPGSSFVEVAGGHFSPEESPEQVAAALGRLVTAASGASV